MTAEGGADGASAGTTDGDGLDDRFAVVDSAVTHEGLLTTVQVDRVAMPDGVVANREIVRRPGAVAVVPLTAAGEVVLVHQYRHAVGRYELEIPAGLLDVAGEPPDDAAQRELSEEIGMAAGRLERLTRIWNSAGWTDEATILYAGHDLRAASPDGGFTAEAEEADMAVLRMPLSSAVGKVHSGEITDAKTVIGLLLVAGGASGDP